MASEYTDDTELKDEELVDFEGSDYDIGSEEDLEADGEEFAEENEQEIHQHEHSEPAGPSDRSSNEAVQSTQRHSEENQKSDISTDPLAQPPLTDREAENGELEQDKVCREESATFVAACNSQQDDGQPTEHMVMDENKHRKHRNPDLEDGELDDSVTLDGFDVDLEQKVKDEPIGHERKRRKEGKSPDRDEFVVRQQQGHGSDRVMEHVPGFPRAGGRGSNMHIGLGLASLAPGIMGPGRPFMPLGIESLARGLGPLGGISLHGRPPVHLEELLVQDQMFRAARAMQLAPGSIASAVRFPMNGPLGPATLRPLWGLDVLGPGPHLLKQFHQPHSEFLSQFNFSGHGENIGRGQRPSVASGRLNGSRRQVDSGGGVSWPCGWASEPAEMQNLRRGRGQSHRLPSGFCAEREHAFGDHGSTGWSLNPGNMFRLAIGAQDMAADFPHVTSDEVRVHWSSQNTSETGKHIVANEIDARFKIEKGRLERRRMHQAERAGCDDMIGGSSDIGRAVKLKTGEVGNAPSSATGSNVIQLLQPVRKSRVLTVSGLPEDVPMSTIMEAFEKLGKITDFRKGNEGDFTICYSTETEAVTAKRNMHRSQIAGKQITVEYAHQ